MDILNGCFLKKKRHGNLECIPIGFVEKVEKEDHSK